MQTVVDALDRHRAELDWHDALSFSTDDTLACESYASLSDRAQRIARALLAVASPGDRIVLAFPAGLDFVATFFGCLYAGVIAVPIACPRGQIGHDQLEAIRRDCEPVAIVTAGNVTLPKGIRALAFDEIKTEHEPLQRRRVKPDDIALLQYTSGSTGRPSGVLVSHHNLVSNSKAIGAAFQLSRESRGVMWLPHYHNMGLVAGIVHPVVEGFPITLLCPWKVMQNPVRWLRAMSSRRGTSSGGPNFAFAECVRRISDDDCNGLDLSSWDLAFVGGEPVRTQVLARFAARFERIGFRKTSFYPVYGLAEATLLVTGGPKGEFQREIAIEGQAEAVVDCGRPVPLHDVAIVSEDGRCSEGEEGEIWVSGPSVTRGCWNQVDDARFSARIPGDDRSYLRTGDCGLMVEGRLAITGRLKDLIIIRGVKYHPEDIECTLASADEGLFGCASVAFSVPGQDSEELIILQEVADEEEERLSYLRDRLRRHVLSTLGVLPGEVVLVTPGSLPRTSSGKVRRSECRTEYMRMKLQQKNAPAVTP